MFANFDNKGKTFTNVITKKPVAVHIQTISQLIKGLVHVRPDERLKDELNHSELFIAVTDAQIYSLDGKQIHQCDFLAVNRTQIVWLFQDNERQPDQEVE
jgi:hypothetical protein